MYFNIMLSFLVLSAHATVFPAATSTAPPLARALHSVRSAPSATTSTPFDILAPATPLAQPSHRPLHLMERCESPPCSYGGEAQTPSAQTVTSTIMSTTSVPCYITTYITNSETITSTIYSTETITSTITEENTIYIIKYSPTPVVRSEVYESVIQVTMTGTRMWVETQGEGWEETKTGDVKTVDGSSGSGGGYGGDKGGQGDGQWKDAAPAPAANQDKGEWGPANKAAPAPAPSSAPASQGVWTHATAAAAAAVVTPGAGVNAAGVAIAVPATPAAPITQGGWSTAGQGVTVAGQPAVGATWPNSATTLHIIGTWPVWSLPIISLILGACLIV